ncbi:MAG: threonine--tRNA ligase [Defluviitaleaceae bacterium]|nr:threonine--tRNA ligase [Defluviitaleaceae bacterium]
MIKITFPDKSIREYENETTASTIAASISPSLRKKCVAAKLNGEIYDLARPILADASLELITNDNPDAMPVLNHSCAHLMAQAIKRLYPDAKFGVGPAIEEGFYYDFDTEEKVTDEDLVHIEKMMTKIASEALDMTRKEVTREEAQALFQDDEYKLALIDAIEEGQLITIYAQGEFADLCAGGHVTNTKEIKFFKLLTVAGAYWRGDSKNKMLTRIYGYAAFSKAELEAYLDILKARKERDHKKLGKELEIFYMNPLSGQGFPILLPNGATIRKQITKYVTEIEEDYGFQHVFTPVIGSSELYKTSGHWDHYRDDMFIPMNMDGEELVLRPMSCPHHMMIYASKMRSYRDLPVRLAEEVIQHRYEASGALTGLERVRAMTLTDAHLFVRPDQIKTEFAHCLKMIHQAIEDFGIEVDYYSLSLRDPDDKEKYFDDDAMWNTAETMLAEVLEANDVDFVRMPGEAAFYGPKLDIQIKTALGHELTLSTIQLDFLLPERFDLTYIDENGEKVRPVVIHRGFISTYERLLAYLIELYKGAFPMWLAPTQVTIIPVNNNFHSDYANEIVSLLKKHRIRFNLDNREEKLGYKIRESQTKKVPMLIVLGDKEVEDQTITVRRYGQEETQTLNLATFVSTILEEIANKSR